MKKGKFVKKIFYLNQNLVTVPKIRSATLKLTMMKSCKILRMLIFPTIFQIWTTVRRLSAVFSWPLRMTDGNDDTDGHGGAGDDDAGDDWWEFWMDTFSGIQSMHCYAHGS